MYMVQIKKTATNNNAVVDGVLFPVYHKSAIIVCSSYDEYDRITKGISACMVRVRKKMFRMLTDLTPLLPNDGHTWYIYVEYRYIETLEWEKEVWTIIRSTTNVVC